MLALWRFRLTAWYAVISPPLFYYFCLCLFGCLWLCTHGFRGYFFGKVPLQEDSPLPYLSVKTFNNTLRPFFRFFIHKYTALFTKWNPTPTLLHDKNQIRKPFCFSFRPMVLLSVLLPERFSHAHKRTAFRLCGKQKMKTLRLCTYRTDRTELTHTLTAHANRSKSLCPTG